MNSSLIATAWVDFFNLVKKQWKSFAWFVVFGVIVFVVHLFFSLLVVYLKISDSLPGIILQLLELLLYVFAMSFLGYGIVRSINDESGETTISALFSRGRDRFFQTFFSGLAMGLLIVLALLVDFLLVYLGYAIAGLLLAGILGAISFVLLFYFIVKLSFVRFRIILENEGPIVAMKSAMEMAQGRWWKTLCSNLFVVWTSVGFVLLTLFFVMMVIVVPFVLINTFLQAGGGLGPVPSLQNFGSSLLGAGSAGTGSLTDLTRVVMNYILGFFGVLILAFTILIGSMVSTFGSVALYRAFKKVQ